MDTFLEYLMTKKSTGKDMLIKTGIVILTLIASVLVMIVFPMIGSFMASYILLGIAAVIYGAYIWLRNYNLEYEYIFTNGDLDIDAIKSKKVRKRIISLQCKNIELMAAKEDPNFKIEFENQSISKRYDAVYDASKGNVYCVIFNKDAMRMLLTFQPPQKLAESMKKLNPRAVHMAEYITEE